MNLLLFLTFIVLTGVLPLVSWLTAAIGFVKLSNSREKDKKKKAAVEP